MENDLVLNLLLGVTVAKSLYSVLGAHLLEKKILMIKVASLCLIFAVVFPCVSLASVLISYTEILKCMCWHQSCRFVRKCDFTLGSLAACFKSLDIPDSENIFQNLISNQSGW